jgi:mRNA-degrading endonuclease toxin of MazEF toxin-antitoxin module
MSTKTSKSNPYYRILLPVGEIVKDVVCTSHIQDSVALCDHVRVIDKNLLQERIGRLSQSAVIGVQLGLAFLFDIR